MLNTPQVGCSFKQKRSMGKGSFTLKGANFHKRRTDTTKQLTFSRLPTHIGLSNSAFSLLAASCIAIPKQFVNISGSSRVSDYIPKVGTGRTGHSPMIRALWDYCHPQIHRTKGWRPTKHWVFSGLQQLSLDMLPLFGQYHSISSGLIVHHKWLSNIVITSILQLHIINGY